MDVATVFMVFATVFPAGKPVIPVVATDSMVTAPYSGVIATPVRVNVPSIVVAESEVAVCVAIDAGNEASGTINEATITVDAAQGVVAAALGEVLHVTCCCPSPAAPL